MKEIVKKHNIFYLQLTTWKGQRAKHVIDILLHPTFNTHIHILLIEVIRKISQV